MSLQTGWLKSYWSKGGTTHGSSYSYDTHVPLIFWGGEIPQGQTDRKVNIRDINQAKDNGYSFFWESLFIFYKKKYIIKEIPVVLSSRYYGSSKMKISDIIYALFYLIKVFLKK